MKYKVKWIVYLILLMSLMSACNKLNFSSSDDPNLITNKPDANTIQNIDQTGMTKTVPAEYMTNAQTQGSVIRVDYESKDYVRDGSKITKTAYVYLPYGYDQNDTETKYNIFYLMHGWGGRAGEYFSFSNIKNMLDHLIENGDIEPTIFVSPTFYNENSDREFSGSVKELRDFHNDFTNHLMPTIEGQFNTYAQSTSKEDLIASRDHRGFGGFSLGSVTTWMEFAYDYDYIRYFLPMSGSSWYFGGYGDYYPEETSDFFEELVTNNDLNNRGYFIYVATGTNDSVRDQVNIQMDEMLSRNDFFTSDHVVYYMKENGLHNFDAVQEYMYNALPLFFRD